jgi:hypothetical protein
MKRNIKLKMIGAALLVAAFALSMFGCTTIGMKLKPVTVIGKMEKRPRLVIGSISVDKASGGRSVEREIKRILPSMLEDRGFDLSADDSDACLIDVLVIEREFISGTSSVRSFMLEIAIMQIGGGSTPQPAVIARKSVEGSSTAASSADLYDMLSMAIDALAKKGFVDVPKAGKIKPVAALRVGT